ncbi:trypsin-like peptidase domain-containing protein [Fertoebacter nigrum]|uniref:Trypsin-like peptidase domain-containing protein n=1 Tax=Fertoeibacter niger TaxID=2656921 RepID=A0A8X8H331_9RHOB|nr:trypsin-like peptidase domain-containing protein [Fertoeibacter niger]NUB46285.1 trypsin-like peptidase domain-containing protein [Fertoeibacter niger]
MRPAPRIHLPLLRPIAELLLALCLLACLAVASVAQAAEMGSDALERAMASVFTVHSAGNDDRFLGSAFLWGDGQVAVTNAHVVGAADAVRLRDTTGAEQVALVIARDPVRDVAVLAVAPGGAGLQPGPAPALGADVWALGAPLELGFSVTRGVVSAVARQVEPQVPLRLIQHDAAVNPGSSGGPLLDGAGRLVGMNSRIADGSRHYIGISFGITGADLSRIVPGLVDESLLPVPQLGLRLRPVTRQIAAALGVTGGLLVDEVLAQGLADQAGLLAGDVMLAADGAGLAGAGDLAFAIEAAMARGAVALTLWRAGAEMSLSLGLEDPATPVTLLRDLSGAVAQRVTSYRLESLGLRLSEGGVVADVTDNSPALWAGLAMGDRILALNGQVLDLAGLRAFDITAPVLLLVQRESGATVHLLVDPWAKTGPLRPLGNANVLDPAVVVF